MVYQLWVDSWAISGRLAPFSIVGAYQRQMTHIQRESDPINCIALSNCKVEFYARHCFGACRSLPERCTLPLLLKHRQRLERFEGGLHHFTVLQILIYILLYYCLLAVGS